MAPCSSPIGRHSEPTINLYDAFHVIAEDGQVERWPIDARRVS